MKLSLWILLSIVLLAGCDSIKDLGEMSQKQAMVQRLIKKSYGWEAKAGWSLQDGELTEVTIWLKGNEVGGESVSDLEVALRDVVSQAFHAKPTNLFVQIALSVEDWDSTTGILDETRETNNRSIDE